MFEKLNVLKTESLANPLHVLRCLGELALIYPLEDFIEYMKTTLSEANDVFPED